MKVWELVDRPGMTVDRISDLLNEAAKRDEKPTKLRLSWQQWNAITDAWPDPYRSHNSRDVEHEHKFLFGVPVELVEDFRPPRQRQVEWVMGARRRQLERVRIVDPAKVRELPDGTFERIADSHDYPLAGGV